jgi:serine/threonine-protein kinase RsbT
MVAGERRVVIRSDADILVARQQGRTLAEQLGFAGSELTVIATAISEVARNIVEYAGSGEMVIRPLDSGFRHGIIIISHDEGPGIPDVSQAMQDGYSTSGGLGMGLPGARRLMDELEVTSELGRGTTVTMKKWKH